MRTDRSLRLPLQIGTSALYSLARGSLLAVPGLVLLSMVAMIWWLMKEGVDLGDGGGYLIVAIATPGMVVGGFAWKPPKRAHAEPPSDLIVGCDGFEIHGGPHDRETCSWADVVDVAIATPPKPKRARTSRTIPICA